MSCCGLSLCARSQQSERALDATGNEECLWPLKVVSTSHWGQAIPPVRHYWQAPNARQRASQACSLEPGLTHFWYELALFLAGRDMQAAVYRKPTHRGKPDEPKRWVELFFERRHKHKQLPSRRNNPKSRRPHVMSSLCRKAFQFTQFVSPLCAIPGPLYLATGIVERGQSIAILLYNIQTSLRRKLNSSHPSSLTYSLRIPARAATSFANPPPKTGSRDC